MRTISDKIPLPDYKVLLVQLMGRLLDRLVDTGLKPTSKRNSLLLQTKESMRALEREFKRDVTISDTADHKRGLFMEMYDTGSVPKWLLIVIMESLMEETGKLNK